MVGAIFGRPLIEDNINAINVIVTVFAVFAGFLVAIITFVGDPVLLPSGSWREVENRRDGIEANLIRYMWLFIIYLMTIGLIFFSLLINKSNAVPVEFKHWVESLYLGFGVTGFLLSMALPKVLKDMQQSRVESEINRRRAEENIRD